MMTDNSIRKLLPNLTEMRARGSQFVLASPNQGSLLENWEGHELCNRFRGAMEESRSAPEHGEGVPSQPSSGNALSNSAQSSSPERFFHWTRLKTYHSVTEMDVGERLKLASGWNSEIVRLRIFFTFRTKQMSGSPEVTWGLGDRY